MSGNFIHASTYVLSALPHRFPTRFQFFTHFPFCSRRVERHKHENDMFTEIDHKREMLGKSWN